MHATREGLGSSQRVLPLLGEKGIPTMLEEEIYMDAERYLNEHMNNSEVSNGFHTTFELGAEASESTALEEVYLLPLFYWFVFITSSDTHVKQDLTLSE